MEKTAKIEEKKEIFCSMNGTILRSYDIIKNYMENPTFNEFIFIEYNLNTDILYISKCEISEKSDNFEISENDIQTGRLKDLLLNQANDCYKKAIDYTRQKAIEYKMSEVKCTNCPLCNLYEKINC